jgi:hypothetical protein
VVHSSCLGCSRLNLRAGMRAMTERLIDAALAPGSSYDLPDPPHARPEQLRKAYPRRDAVLTAKRRSDPQLRFKNALWDRYMARDSVPSIAPTRPSPASGKGSSGADDARQSCYFEDCRRAQSNGSAPSPACGRGLGGELLPCPFVLPLRHQVLDHMRIGQR